MKQPPNSARRIRQISRCLLAAFVGSQHIFAAEADVSKLPPAAARPVDFARDIQPILETSCLRCHGPEHPKSKFRLDNRAAALKGGDEGVDILPGNSTHSPLIHYVAYLVGDAEMPPLEKGKQLTTEQVSLLRAWIDQGVVWDAGSQTNQLDFSFSPVLGGTTVSGDNHKFRELNSQKEGLNGGGEHFELCEQPSPDLKRVLTGHALLDDYLVVLSVEQNDLGFIHSGWQEYRKYYDDTGGYFPVLNQIAPSLGHDLHLDIGKVWIDSGLNLPDWPRLELGYEYDYRHGDEALTEWSTLNINRTTARNLAPASKSINENVHVIKFNLDAEIKGVAIEERFRGEFYQLAAANTNVALGPLPQSASEGTTYFQGANTLRLEKKFSGWCFGSAGYLYSKLDADSAFRLEAPTLLQITTVPDITLEKESHVGNVNGLLGPFAGLVISTGAQAEWTRQRGLGTGIFEQANPPPALNNFPVPFNLASDYDETSVQESLAVRYAQIPFASLFAEARLEQQNIAQSDQFAAAQDILGKAVFLQHTAFSSELSDFRFGFSTSPWRSVSFSAHYRRHEDDSQYASDPLVQPTATAYPTFIRSLDLITDEIEAKLVLHPSARFKTTLAYEYHTTEYNMATSPYLSFGNLISPGGQLLAGEDQAQIFSLSLTLTPLQRLFLSATLSYQTSTTATAAGNSPAVVPYRGDTYSVLVDGTFVLNQTTDLFASYVFSAANYGQNNFAGGLPLGIQYQRHGVQVGLSRKLRKNISAKLQYRFDCYNEPSSGGADNYQAHAIFGLLTFQFP